MLYKNIRLKTKKEDCKRTIPQKVEFIYSPLKNNNALYYFLKLHT